MGRGRKRNPFAEKKRKNKENGKDPRPDRRSMPYEEIKRENDAFIKYYKEQNICDTEEEWEEFLASIRDNFPVTFRVTGYKDEAKALMNIIETQLFANYTNSVAQLYGISEEEVEPPLRLPWYPDGLAYQLQLTRKDIRRSEPLFQLHNFLIVETNAGSISRQEAVSMIPPILLDVKPTDKVLDMCAAPGSKTAQLIEALHAEPDKYKIPPGIVVANDVDNNRCYMLVHQAKRLNSPCCVVTNHDSCFFPNMKVTAADGSLKILKFDKILCDVPCSGDGTLRKNPDIWGKWNLGQAYNLHGVQYRITRRAAEILEVGGRMVYSTCSLNPIENESVLQRIISDADGALEIVQADHLVPGLKFKPGMTNWKLASKDVTETFTSFEEVPEKYHTIIRPAMFPLPKEKIEALGLEKCLRILPHLQDTGGFFVAVIEKRRQMPFEKNDVKDLVEKPKDDEKLDKDGNPIETKVQPSRKRRRMHGYREDPYVFFEESDTDYDEIKKFFDLSDDFNKLCLLTRCKAEKKKNIYYCSEAIRDLVLLNEQKIKVINTGVKSFVRCDNRHNSNSFRLAQEGLQTTNAFVGLGRRIDVTREDLIVLLNCRDPSKPPSTELLDSTTQERWKQLDVGSCILKYEDPRFLLHLVGWRGSSSLRGYVDSNETVHVLRLLGADLTNFVVNKFEKPKEEVVDLTADEDSVELVDISSDSGGVELPEDSIESSEEEITETITIED